MRGGEKSQSIAKFLWVAKAQKALNILYSPNKFCTMLLPVFAQISPTSRGSAGAWLPGLGSPWVDLRGPRQPWGQDEPPKRGKRACASDVRRISGVAERNHDGHA